MSEFTIDVNEENFDSVVINSDKPVLVDFWAEWCGPCKMLTPTIEALAEEYKDTSSIVKINVDDSPAIATKYGIRSIPSILLFNNGDVIEQRVGAVSKDELAGMLDKIIKG
jgi:thioredoxin 1